MINSAYAETTGIIGKINEGGKPVIYSLVNELPKPSIRNQKDILTVISWKYDGSSNNGMPVAVENNRMIKLEDALVEQFPNSKHTYHAYNRTGNNLKEFSYYVRSKEKFMKHLNSALAGHSRYPIEIKFYEDGEWTEMRKLLEDFAG